MYGIGSSASSRVLVPAEPHELDAPTDEHQREDQHEQVGDDPQHRVGRGGPSSGQTSTSKCVPSRTPIIAPSMTIQMKRKRDSSSVQIQLGISAV